MRGSEPADERAVPLEDDLTAAERRHGLLTDRLEPEPPDRVRLGPEALLELHLVAVDLEAGSVQRSLGVELVVHEGGDELHVGLRLDEAAHVAERAEQRPVRDEHARDDRVVGPAPRLHPPGHGEAGTAILEHDAGPGRNHAGAEAVVEALDERHGHAVAVDCAQVDRAGPRLGYGKRRGGAALLEEGGIEQLGDVGAVPHAGQAVLERELRRDHARREIGAEPFEQAQRLERDDALRGRRQLEHLDTAIGDGERIDPARAEGREILLVEPARRADRTRDATAVEGRGAVARDRPQASAPAPGSGRAGLLAGSGRAPAARCSRPTASAVIGADREAPLGGVDRVRETRVEPEPAVSLGERGPAGDGTRDGHRQRPDLGHGLQVLGRGGRRPGGVEALGLAVPPDDREAVAADPGRHGLGHRKHGGGGDGGVGRVAATLEHAQTRAGGELLAGRDHRAGGDGRRAAEREAEGHRHGSYRRPASQKHANSTSSLYHVGVLTIYDAARCPYCARVRIALAEKGIEHELVAVNLDERPAFIIELNPPNGRVPVLEEDSFILPESAVINEYLEERYPDPPLLPLDAAERALARLLIYRFDELLGDPYYDLYSDRPGGSPDASLGRARRARREAGSIALPRRARVLAGRYRLPAVDLPRGDEAAIRPLAVRGRRRLGGAAARAARRGRRARRRRRPVVGAGSRSPSLPRATSPPFRRGRISSGPSGRCPNARLRSGP